MAYSDNKGYRSSIEHQQHVGICFRHTMVSLGYLRPKNICQMLKQEVQRATYRAPEYNVPLFDGSARVAVLFFSDRPEKHKLVTGC